MSFAAGRYEARDQRRISSKKAVIVLLVRVANRDAEYFFPLVAGFCGQTERQLEIVRKNNRGIGEQLRDTFVFRNYIVCARQRITREMNRHGFIAIEEQTGIVERCGLGFQRIKPDVELLT